VSAADLNRKASEMIPAISIASFYWWAPMIVLSYAHFRWCMHLGDRLTSKARKRPDDSLPKKAKTAMRTGLALIGFYVAHLAVVSWEKPMDTIILWCCGYLMLTLLAARNIRSLRQCLREYHEILQRA
jgi:hypothetical protein